MAIFDSEQDLLKALDLHDDLVRQCVAGNLSFDEFCAQYNDFYAYYALDGHESDLSERALFEKSTHRIRPHEFIAYDILGCVCSDTDAELVSYKLAGRFGSKEAIERLSRLQFPKLFKDEA